MNIETLPAHIGKYRVKRLLGSGGMGHVFLAVDPDIGREVAIKLVTLGKDPQAKERFLREAQTMGRLNHPNIVTLLEFGVDQQSPFLVLEFLSGEDLSQWMRKPQSLHDQVRIMLGVAEAIAAAHRVGVLHRDLKPDNVRVLEDGRCKLLDFGIAQSGAASLTASGYFVGTPEFVAPEVMIGASHTAASDIYALGLLFYTMLVGTNPFCGDTVQTIVARVLAIQVPPLGSRIRGVPAPLMTLIERCLPKAPEDRPESAEVLVLELRKILADINLQARVERIATPAETTRIPIGDGPTRGTATKPAAPRSHWLVWGLTISLATTAGVWLLRPPPPEPRVAIPDRKPDASLPSIEPATPGPSATPTPTVETDPTLPAPAATKPPPAPVTKPAAPPESESIERIQTAPVSRPAPTPPDVRDEAVEPLTSPEPRRTELVPIDAQSPPPAPPEASPPAPETPAPALPDPALRTVEIQRVSPRVIRAGRSVTLRIEGNGLDAITAAMMSSGGVPDTRFRIGALKHAGGSLEFTLTVARGVPLGRYPLLLQGVEAHAEPIILEVSL